MELITNIRNFKEPADLILQSLSYHFYIQVHKLLNTFMRITANKSASSIKQKQFLPAKAFICYYINTLKT